MNYLNKDVLSIINDYSNSLNHYDKFRYCLNDIKNIQYESDLVFSSRKSNEDVVIYFINITHRYFMDDDGLNCESKLKLKIFKNKEKRLSLNY
jgi:hypothetical protein|tara:strand:+ start:5531 stop:5809 length:279 start_codon:yes stop_codon:yes gene_type:complete